MLSLGVEIVDVEGIMRAGDALHVTGGDADYSGGGSLGRVIHDGKPHEGTRGRGAGHHPGGKQWLRLKRKLARVVRRGFCVLRQLNPVRGCPSLPDAPRELHLQMFTPEGTRE